MGNGQRLHMQPTKKLKSVQYFHAKIIFCQIYVIHTYIYITQCTIKQQSAGGKKSFTEERHKSYTCITSRTTEIKTREKKYALISTMKIICIGKIRNVLRVSGAVSRSFDCQTTKIRVSADGVSTSGRYHCHI